MQTEGVFILVLVRGRAVNKYKLLGEEGGGFWCFFVFFFALFFTTSRASGLQWLLAVGEKCETMIHVNEKPWTQ